MTETTPSNTPETEPTVLDLYKSVTKDWASFFNFLRSLWDARRREALNRSIAEERSRAEESAPEEAARDSRLPWRALLALFLALCAQYFLELKIGAGGLALYLLAGGVALRAYRQDAWRLPALPAPRSASEDPSARLIPFLASILLGLAAFLDFGSETFALRNTALWLAATVCFAYSLWSPSPAPRSHPASASLRWLLLAAAILALFFRLSRTADLPAEPFSDHAEKILDVYDISQGKYPVFFPRNTGREALQMYWTYLVASVFGTGLSFYSLKLGTALLGLLTLPYVYRLGKEFGNARVGFFAFFLFGISYWNNVISRIGLRFPLYPLFVAPVLFHLARGLRLRRRNDFLLAGLFLGLGLHGYSPFRIVPLLVLAAFGLYGLHEKQREARSEAAQHLVVLIAASAFVFLPLLRYWISHPDIFGYRAFSRLSSLETPLPAPAWQIFLSNLYKGLLTFNWDDGEIWVNSLPHRPALDMVGGALFVLGIFLLIARYARARDWRDGLILLSVPVLILPSVLSLAYPGENPALNRAGGAAIPAILVAALALDSIFSTLAAEKKRAAFAYALTALLLLFSAAQNYDIVFRQFDQNFKNGAWNTSEMGKVIRQFKEKHGQTETIWVVPFPHWVDTRLPGVWAGIPNRDFALWRENLSDTLNLPAPKTFLFWNADLETQNELMRLYPNGTLSRYVSSYPGKDFMIFTVEE